jgi:hypothetical protein
MSLVKTKRTFESANILSVEVHTSAPRGGDSAPSSIELDNSSGWTLVADGKRIERAEMIRLELRGDTEAETVIEALEFAARSLREQMLLNRAGVTIV